MDEIHHQKTPTGQNVRYIIESEELFSLIRKIETDKINILSKIYDKYKVDILSVGFTFVDHGMHNGSMAGRFHDPFEFYEIQDEILQLLFERFKPDNFLLTSDHGMRYKNTDKPLGHSKDGVFICSKKNITTGEIHESDVFEWIMNLVD
jgi:hypothetical protein